MNGKHYFLAAVWLLLTDGLHAEGNCPSGMFQTTPVGQAGPIGCAPIPNYSSTPAQPAGPQWGTRWGAMATDPDTASLGSVEGMPSKRKATKAALTACEQQGGKNCTVNIAYYNQCAAMVVGDNRIRFSGAATLEEATARSMNKCNASDTNCELHYTACSLPEQVR